MTPTATHSGARRGAPRALALAAALSLTTMGAACSSGSGSTVATTQVEVRLADYSITPSTSENPQGKVRFAITNGGSVAHELVVARTDLPAGALPVDAKGVVDEEAGLDIVDEQEHVQAGNRSSLTVDLTPGSYVLFCNLDDHYSRGMHRAFEVKPT